MLRMLGTGIAAALLWAALAHAVQVCAWLDETVGEDDYHELKLWMEADGDVDAVYRIKGDGLVNENTTANAPNGGTFFLRPRRPDSHWTFGVTLAPPGRIDVIVELRAKPADIFSDEETPLLAAFTFRREIPEGETTPPKTFAAKQCATLGNPR